MCKICCVKYAVCKILRGQTAGAPCVWAVRQIKNAVFDVILCVFDVYFFVCVCCVVCVCVCVCVCV